jgi:hypothetical protein
MTAESGMIPGRSVDFSFHCNSNGLWGPESLLSNKYQWLFPWRTKQLGHEADCSLPSIADGYRAPELHFHKKAKIHN